MKKTGMYRQLKTHPKNIRFEHLFAGLLNSSVSHAVEKGSHRVRHPARTRPAIEANMVQSNFLNCSFLPNVSRTASARTNEHDRASARQPDTMVPALGVVGGSPGWAEPGDYSRNCGCSEPTIVRMGDQDSSGYMSVT